MEWTFVFNLSIAILAGALVGIERQWQHKLAGVRTTALVSFGACLFVTLSTFMAGNDSSPTRIAAQVVSGIGFLAGGVIIRDGMSVTGINTAATLWCSAAVGSIIGAGYRIEGIVGAIMLLIVNISLRGFSKKVDLFRSDMTHHHVAIVCLERKEMKIRGLIIDIMTQLGLELIALERNEISDDAIKLVINLGVNENEGNSHLRIKSFIAKLLLNRSVLKVENNGENE